MKDIDNCPPRSELRDIFDAKGPGGRKAFASSMDVDESLLSRKLSGSQGRDIGLADIWALDRDTQVQFVTRYGALLGLKVTDVSVLDLAAELLDRFAEFQRSADLFAVRARGATVKAELPAAMAARKVG